MQIVRFRVGDATRYGVLEGSSVLAAELTEPLPELPVIALKPPSAVIGPDDPIVLPPRSDFVEHEAELAVVRNPVVKL
jgi:2-keto-4-pentenoate hydratase/2-oxohepta-3-ene-1,7-dioic acid hydratase in catechol pathway